MRATGRLRVLMVTPQFHPSRGGVETHVHEVARRFVDDPDVSVSVLTTDRRRQLAAREIVDGIDVERIPAWPRGSDLFFAPGLARRVRARHPDVVHVQSYHTLVAPLAMLAARSSRLPYLVTLHSGGHSSGLRNRVRGLQLRVERPLLAGARRIIAVSRFEAEAFAEALHVPARRIRVVPNGADTHMDVEIRTNEPRDPDLVLSVARLERYKGHHRLIGALPIVRATRPNARLMIVGSGPYEAALRDLARRLGVEAAVEVRGMPRAEVHALLGRASVVALLSDYESQGIAVYEALMRGCRVVVAEASALAELVGMPGVVGVPVDASPSAVAEALLAQLAGPTGARSGGTALPTWDACAAALKEEYLRAVAPDVATPARNEG